jgi:hypothetical protein
LVFLGEIVGVFCLQFMIARGWPRAFGDAPESGEGAGGDGLRRGKLFLVEKFGEVEDFVDLVFRESLDQLVEFFGGCHDFLGGEWVCAFIMAEGTMAWFFV